MMTPTAKYFYHADGLGSITMITNSAGALIEQYEYDPYGKPTIKDGSGAVIPASTIGNRFMFTGREYDQETGLYHYRARAYSPILGRFLQTDPTGLTYDKNLYRYVRNNPIRWVDPLGLKPGDPYATEEEAATDAINDINPKSISENTEHGGWIYQNPDGTYSYTPPYSGDNDSTSLGPEPSTGKVTGDYHTHGAYDPRYDNENFSPQDKWGNKQTGTSGYLGTPSGRVKKFDPDTNTVKDITPKTTAGGSK